jgi:23S rRNA (pseudouridine1915-N3)-methyltransferase
VHAVNDSFTPRDVRPVPIKIVTVSKDNSKGAQLMAQEWSTKISRYTSISTTSIKPNPLKSNSPDVQKQAEAQKV